MTWSACLRGVLVTLASAFAAASVLAQQDPRPPAVPVDPVAAVLDAFRTHSVVALGEGAPGNEQAHAFQLSLVCNRRFAATVNDIVVECGNARYQDVMDRFIRDDVVSRRPCGRRGATRQCLAPSATSQSARSCSTRSCTSARARR